MKAILLLFFCTSFVQLNAKSRLRLEYNIKSDVKDTSVEKGKCLVTGTTTFSGQALGNSLISTLDGLNKCYSDSSGHYSLLLDESDTAIFFFHKDYEEQVIWKYNFQSQHHVEIDFYAAYNNMFDAVDKPVIYLYSEQELTVNIGVDFIGDITFSYPVLEDNTWTANISEQGINVKGNDFPYLFWEGDMTGLNYKKENAKILGEVVESNEVVTYLERVLNEVGFNQTEMTDFITFWAPKMISYDYVLIQFLQDAEYSQRVASLKVEPEPTNSLRMYMLFTGFDSKPTSIETVPQRFEKLERTGFTLVDWGGSELSSDYHL